MNLQQCVSSTAHVLSGHRYSFLVDVQSDVPADAERKGWYIMYYGRKKYGALLNGDRNKRGFFYNVFFEFILKSVIWNFDCIGENCDLVSYL